MVIYLDVLIIVNIYITYFTLKATAKLLHLGYKTKRLISASVLGGLFSLSAVIKADIIFLILLRVLMTFIITVTAFGFPNIRRLILRMLINIGGGTLVCGISIMLRECTGSSLFNAAGGYPYLNISVMTLIIATTAAYTALTVFRRICDKPSTDELIKITIIKDGKTASISAYPDSGNNLRDFLTGLPVIVCRKDKIKGIFTLENEEELPSGARIIPFSSIGGNGFITAFKPDSLTAEYGGGKEKNIEALIGTGGDSLENESFDAIINPKILI